MGGVTPPQAKTAIFPAGLNLAQLNVVLAGCGAAYARRKAQLEQAGAAHLKAYELPADEKASLPDGLTEAVARARVLMLVDAPDSALETLIALGKEAGALVNVEDKPELCDFYFMSEVRRGDLLLAVSTGGKSPALAKTIRRWLEQLFPPVWEERLNELAARRLAWRAQGLGMARVLEESEKLLAACGWEPEPVLSASLPQNKEPQSRHA